MKAGGDVAEGPVALVIQCRIADEGFADFIRWNGRVGARLKSWPGFLGQELAPPKPPAHDEWVAILHFTDAAAARDWLQSDVRASLVEEVRHHFLEPEETHILRGAGVRQDTAVSAVISFAVPPELESDFLGWQERVQAVEAGFPGFLRHKIERPVPGLHDNWIVILSFDSDANLGAWLESPQRQALLEEGARFNADLIVKRAAYGFNFWFPSGAAAPEQGPAFIFKCNLLVLLVLYPVVYLWGYFIGRPLIDAHGVPFWLSLFVGNLVSTQLLGWWLVPAAFKVFDWWLSPTASAARQAAGYAIVTLCYILSMALYAALLARLAG